MNTSISRYWAKSRRMEPVARLHGRGLRIAAHAGNGKTDVHGRALAREEQVAFQEDLAVRDGNDVGGNVGGNVARLGFHDGQRGHAAAAPLIRKMRGALEQARVQVEYVARIGLAARGTAQ